MAEQWWPIYRINFSKKQMQWLIENLADLKVGNYPESPASSGYDIDIPRGKGSRRYKEPAINRVLELAAEVECRLDLVMNLLKGWRRLDRKYYRDKEGHIRWRLTRSIK